ncbi:MAG TPA: drug/metabolite exporter YedA [Anaeromyxobacteraceae bacterium]|nr:drug/metabolite exporter YedA [Anaeromyxobacteraceae bacterium]
MLVALSLLCLYLVWGSTYFAIRVGLEGLPPLLMAGTRFVAAGGVLYAGLRLRGAPRPSARAWRSAAVVGVLLCGSNGLVTLAEQEVSSSVAAVVISSMPLWAMLLAALWGERPSALEIAGVAVGLAGVVLLQAGGELRARPLGAALIVLSTWTWASGSMWSRRTELPVGLLAPAAEMLCGGAVLVALGLAAGERIPALPAARPLIAWLFLAFFGSLLAYSAYNFLLRRVRPALATSYAYVNPAVAVALGAMAGEPVTARVVGSMALILGGVAVMSRGGQRP